LEANWKDALLGEETAFPELATSLQAAAACVAGGIRYEGFAAYHNSGADRSL